MFEDGRFGFADVNGPGGSAAGHNLGGSAAGHNLGGSAAGHNLVGAAGGAKRIAQDQGLHHGEGSRLDRTQPPRGTPNTVLMVLHQERSTPGRIGRLLRERGYRLDIRRPRFGDPLPRNLDAHAGAVVFGGPMSANDPDDWLRRETDWIGVPLAAGKPFLGICLGAQLLARHLGHRVGPHPRGRVEVGYYPVRATAAGRELWPDLPAKVYQWHCEGFDVPAGATLLAEGDDFRAQAYRVGSHAYGLQFHPEVTYQMMCRWTVTGEDRLAMPGALPRAAHFRDWFLHDAAVARWLDGFLRRWIAGDARTRMTPQMAPQPVQPMRRATAPAGASVLFA